MKLLSAWSFYEHKNRWLHVCVLLQASSSCLSDPPRTSVLPVGHGSLSSVTHQCQWKPGPAVQRKLRLPKGPPSYSELISKQGKRSHFKHPVWRVRVLLPDCLASISFGYIWIVTGSARSINPLLSVLALINNIGTKWWDEMKRSGFILSWQMTFT